MRRCELHPAFYGKYARSYPGLLLYFTLSEAKRRNISGYRDFGASAEFALPHEIMLGANEPHEKHRARALPLPSMAKNLPLLPF